MRKIKLKSVVQQNELHIDIFDDIMSKEIEIEDGWLILKDANTSVAHISEEIRKAGAVEKIVVRVNSYGGEADQGIAIFNLLENQKIPVETINIAVAGSAASIIMQAGKRRMYSNSMLFIHNAATSCYGNADKFRKIADDLENCSKTWCSTYMQKSNGKITQEELDVLLKAESWISPEKCLAYGLVDEIIDAEMPENENTEETNQTVETLRAEIEQLKNEKIELLSKNETKKTSNFQKIIKNFKGDI